VCVARNSPSYDTVQSGRSLAAIWKRLQTDNIYLLQAEIPVLRPGYSFPSLVSIKNTKSEQGARIIDELSDD
jgi:hypothetical protein